MPAPGDNPKEELPLKYTAEGAFDAHIRDGGYPGSTWYHGEALGWFSPHVLNNKCCEALLTRYGWKQTLPFQKVEHQVSTLDAQPASDAGAILVMVTGALLVGSASLHFGTYRFSSLTWVQVDEEKKPISYSQVFHLLPDGAGSYYVFNDIFRLVYAG
jgi:hypothetical protein